MKTQHTKGEWRIASPIKGYEKSIMVNQIAIADLPNVEITTDNKGENKANAKLIAAAPELLENLLRLVDRIEESEIEHYFPSAVRRAKEAIKQATG